MRPSTLCGVGALALAVGLAAASCAPLPPPRGAPVPPAGPQPRPGAPASPPRFRLAGEPPVEVGLAWDQDSLALTAAHARVTWWVDGAGPPARGASPALTLRLAKEGARFEGWSDGRAVVGPLAAADTLWVGEDAAAGSLATPSVRWNGKTWRGSAKVFLGPRGRLTLALRLPLESYLIGVVPGEIGALSEALLQAGRAQAIAARSYTLFYRGRRGAEGFDLYGTVEDQVYSPVESERPLATRCVERTRGQFALSGEQPIRANYFSTCGGITADVQEGWPTADFPYLRSRRDAGSGGDFCSGSPQYRWREEWTAADFLKTIATFAPGENVALPAPGLGELLDVRVVARSHSARVWRLALRTNTGEITIPAYAIRRVLRRPGNNAALLRSNLFKVDVRRDPRTRRARAVVLSGAGFGHGVGLCQTGALGMARAGHSGEQILEHYYAGIALKRLY